MAATASYMPEDEPIDDEAMEPIEDAEVAETTDPVTTAQRMQEIIAIPNIAAVLEADKLSAISGRAIQEYELDDASRAAWKEKVIDATKLAMLEADVKNYPFDGASNVKYPLLTTACYQFSARAYPAIVPGDRVVKAKVNGRDPDGAKANKADRVSEYSSWQMLSQMPEWEDDTDRLLVILPIAGSVFRKRYFDPGLNRQASRLVMAERFVVNYWARSMEDAPRLTEMMYLYPYEIQERIRSGRFIEFEYGTATSGEDGASASDGSDEDAPHLFLEQHRLWDLDEDGYAEPYIVTIHKATGKVCRIVANFTMDDVRIDEQSGKVVAIRRQQFYTKYDFLPSPDGGFYGVGFGWLLRDLNEAINSNLNMLLDSGHQSNIQGGFVSSSLGMKEKAFRVKRGEYKVVGLAGDLRGAILPIKFDPPSEVLFKLLGLLIEMGKEVANVKDVLTGETGGKVMQPTTVLALIEQGLMAFTAIYKRVYRSLKTELSIHCRLNEQHLSAKDYNEFFDDGEQHDPKADFDLKGMDITPMSDPKDATKMLKLGRAEFLQGWAKDNPLANQEEVAKRVLEAADIEDRDKLIAKPPAPDPEQEALLKRGAVAEIEEKEASSAQKLAAALKSIADAEAAEAGPQMKYYDLILKALTAEIGAENAQIPEAGPGGLPAMAGAPGNAAGPQLPGGIGGDQGGAGENQPVPLGGDVQQPGMDMGSPAP